MTRPASLAAFVAAAGFGVEGIISLFHHTGDEHWGPLSQALNGAYAVAALALIVALPAVGLWLQVNRIGRGAVIAAQIGYAAMVVESIVSALHDGNILGGVFFGGLLLALFGLLVLGIVAVIGGHHRWAALLPFLGMLVGIAGGEHGGSVMTAAVWIVLGTALLRTDS
jgi:hypothetical protein